MASIDFLSGHPGHLDQQQESALVQFRQELLAEGLMPQDRAAVAQRLGYDRYDDQTLLRFLRARKFDLPRAKLMWSDNEKWRKDFGADEIAANGYPYPEQSEVNKYYPQFYHRTDRDGRPIYIEQLGKLDMNKIGALTTQDRQLHHLVHEYEKFLKDRLPACGAQKGELVETSCTILDLHNAGISTFYRVKDYVSAASGIGQNHSRNHGLHVHRQRQLFFMCLEKLSAHTAQAPYLFSTVWSLVKPWLDEATVRKIHILGKNYKTELANYIDASSLPTDLGGKCSCAGGCMNSDAGPWNKVPSH